MGFSTASIPGTAKVLDDFSGLFEDRRVRVRWYRHVNEKTGKVKEWIAVSGLDEPLVMQFTGRRLPEAAESVRDLHRSLK